MNIVDYILIIFLLLYALKGFKNGLLPALVSLVSSILIFVIAFYLKGPISILLYENLPFLNFAGIFKGVIAANILFYEGVAYVISFGILIFVFVIIKKLSKFIQKILSITLFLTIPFKIIGALIGIVEGILCSFVLLYVSSVINTTAPYVNESKYASIILNNIPILNNITSDLTTGTKEVYNVILNNKNDTNKANLESIEILMKYDILSYDSAKKLVDDGKLNIDGIENIIEEYKES